jgi:hypothetical protein
MKPQRVRGPSRETAIINRITRPKAASPKLPSATPTASSAAASLPRRVPGRPAFSLRSRTCFWINVALAVEKEATNDGPEAGRDETRDYGHRSTEPKSDEVLVPARLTKGGRLEMNDHVS